VIREIFLKHRIERKKKPHCGGGMQCGLAEEETRIVKEHYAARSSVRMRLVLLHY
jgi:hypothetical protein